MKLVTATSLLTVVCALVLCAPAISMAADPKPGRFLGTEGWHFQYARPFNLLDIQEKLDLLRLAGRVPRIFELMLETQGDYEWHQCGIVVPEIFSLIVGPSTRVIVTKTDSSQVTSVKLVFTDSSVIQCWDTQVTQIALGPLEDTDILSLKPQKISLRRDGKKDTRAVAYIGFMAMPRHSGVMNANIRDVLVTGVTVDYSRARERR